MADTFPFPIVADLVLALHLALVVFIVGGLLAILVGNARKWGWVNRPLFRSAHLAAIAAVIAEAWLGLVCPLTTAEQWLRSRAVGTSYEGGFIEHLLRSLLYYEAPPWVFTAAYTAFGLAVALAWWRFPPRLHRSRA